MVSLATHHLFHAPIIVFEYKELHLKNLKSQIPPKV